MMKIAISVADSMPTITTVPRMRRPAGRQNVFRHSAALFGAQHHAGRAGPAAHQSETVADAEERGRIQQFTQKDPSFDK